ncbi:DUF1722 domain-containing protein [Paraclostridium bifermentans]|nr:DUF1722 domain-containing protein [Paraclostridium bifermentans]
MGDELDFLVKKQDLSNEDIDLYKNKVYEILQNNRNKTSKVNTVKTVFEKYKKHLNLNEIKYFEKLLKLYEECKIPFSSLVVAIQMYAVRFDDMELLNQTFFNPYPESLLSITDSGKGRNL